jgi:hypothetical protein
MDPCTQKHMVEATLFPVKRAKLLVKEIIQLVLDHSTATTISNIHLQGDTLPYVGEFPKDCLQVTTCSTYDDKAKIGFNAHEIDTKSIRSGAAMLLFLTKHSSNGIMMLLGS